MKKPINNFKRKVLLFPQSKNPPKYFVSIQSQQGKLLKLADPRINRMALALMDMQAVLGGAASHWGGPSAFAEVVSALYGLVFHYANQKNLPWYSLFHIINDVGHAENGLYALKANYGMLSFSDLKGFRSLNSPLTGHGEAHLFPEGVYLSNGPLGSTLAQAQGLCMADSLTKLKRSTIVLMSDGACMEGEAKEAFSSIPGFFKKMNPFIVIASDNNTKLSGRIDEDSFPLDPFFRSLKALGWDLREIKNGHSLKALVDGLELALLPETLSEKPIFIRVRTIKGYGTKETEKAHHGGHGFPLKNTEKLNDFLEEIYARPDIPDEFKEWAKELRQLDLSLRDPKSKGPKPSLITGKKNLSLDIESPAGQGKTLLSKSFEPADFKSFFQEGRLDKNFLNTLLDQKKVKAQEGIGRALVYCRKDRGLPIVSISADLQGSTGVLLFRKEFPKYSFDVGVAEANMISLGAGFSKQGFIPVVDTFTQFGVTKGSLPLFMANLSQAPVIAVFSHAGLQSAGDGASHQCLTYLSQTSSLPMTDVYSLSSSAEAFSLMTQAIESFALAYQKDQVPKTKIFFLGREVFAPSYLPEEYPYKLGKAQIIYSELKTPGEKTTRGRKTGKAITLWALGPLLEQALRAGFKLSEKGWKVIVVNASKANEPDTDTLLACVQRTNFRLLTLEDHCLKGGMGALVAHKLALKGVKTDMLSLGVKSPFGRSAYKSLELYKKEKLMAEDILETVLSRWS